MTPAGYDTPVLHNGRGFGKGVLPAVGTVMVSGAGVPKHLHGFAARWFFLDLGEYQRFFLDPDSAYFNPNVKGIKTGSLEGAYNLVVLYQQHGKEFLVVSLGSDSDQARYDAVSQILDTIDDSQYLAW